MEVILCALPCEARPIAKYFGLQKINKDKQTNNFLMALPQLTKAAQELPNMYANSKASILLFEIGVGPIEAAKNTKKILCSLKDFTEANHNIGSSVEHSDNHNLTINHIYNVGTCAGPVVGKQYIAAKIIDNQNDQHLYPDLTKYANFEPCVLITRNTPALLSDVKTTNSSRFLNNTNNELNIDNKNTCSDICFDMEAAAVYEQARKFLSPSQITIIKCTSDVGITKNPNKTNFKELEKVIVQTMENVAPELCSLMQKFDSIKKSCINFVQVPKIHAEHSSSKDDRSSLCTQKINTLDKLCEQLNRDLHCSKTASIQLKRKLYYCMLAGINASGFFDNLRSAGKIPAKSKQQTSAIIRQFQEFIDEQ